MSSSGSSDGAAREFFLERLLDFAARQVHRGKHEVIRRFLAELHDELAEVGLDDFAARLLHRVVQMDFLGSHRLGLHDDLRVLLAQDAEDDLAGLLRVACPMDFRAARLDQPDELFKMPVEMVDRIELGARRKVPRALPVLKPQFALVADGFVFAHRRLDDAAMPQVRRNPPGVFVEMGRGARS